MDQVDQGFARVSQHPLDAIVPERIYGQMLLGALDPDLVMDVQCRVGWDARPTHRRQVGTDGPLVNAKTRPIELVPILDLGV